MASTRHYRYLAIDAAGRRTTGEISSSDEAAAFEELRSRGLSPLGFRTVRKRREARVKAPTDRDSADFLASLADLLRAGADIRTSLSILASRSDKGAVKQLTQTLSASISGGDSLDRSFAACFQGRHAFVASMVSAGEAAGDLPGGLQRAAEVFNARLTLREQLVSVLAYPLFVLTSSIGAVFVILLFIVPSIAPLAEDAGANPPASLAALIVASDFLRENLALLGGLTLLSTALVAFAGRAGMLSRPLEALFLDGPARRTVRGIVFGGFSISLGTMLAAGAPVTDALRLANRSVMTNAARKRLEPVVQIVRQGQSLSTALEAVPGFPSAVIRLAAVGEATNALGQMLSRGGKLEEEAAMRRIQAMGRVAGPALIVLLGLLLGTLMAGLLSGVSQMGQAALG